MFLELVATFAVGFGMAGMAMLLGRLSGGRLPRWLMPAAAGVGMLAFVLWSEYSWYGRASTGLPEGFVVASVNESRQIYRPWTYLAPLRDRFVAVDVAGARTNPALPGQKLIDLYLFGRWSPNYRVQAVFDCDGQRRADLLEGVELAADGSVPEDAWRVLAPDDPILEAACREETS